MSMLAFLHKSGYNYFNIPRLTIPEINLLIGERNKEIKEEQRQQRLAKRRGKK